MAAFVIGVVLLIAGLILRFGSVKRNLLFGYRTPRSMRSEKTWQFANQRFASYSIMIGAVSMSLPVLFSFDLREFTFVPLVLTAIAIFDIEWRLTKIQP